MSHTRRSSTPASPRALGMGFKSTRPVESGTRGVVSRPLKMSCIRGRKCKGKQSKSFVDGPCEAIYSQGRGGVEGLQGRMY